MKKSELKKKNFEENKQIEEIHYGFKEMIHGLLMGIILGFMLAWFLLK
jgi:hypothetical protein